MDQHSVEDLARLTTYVRGLITGDRPRLDVIDTRAMEALRRRPLPEFLAELDAAELQLRGARGNEVGDVLDLLSSIAEQLPVSKMELSRRSGVSRGHIISLFKPDGAASRPTLETVIRLAVGLRYPLEVVAQGSPADDDDADVSPSSSPSPERPTIDPPRPPERTFRQGVVTGGILGSTGTVIVGGVIALLRRAGSQGGAR